MSDYIDSTWSCSNDYFDGWFICRLFPISYLVYEMSENQLKNGQIFRKIDKYSHLRRGNHQWAVLFFPSWKQLIYLLLCGQLLICACQQPNIVYRFSSVPGEQKRDLSDQQVRCCNGSFFSCVLFHLERLDCSKNSFVLWTVIDVGDIFQCCYVITILTRQTVVQLFIY